MKVGDFEACWVREEIFRISWWFDVFGGIAWMKILHKLEEITIFWGLVILGIVMYQASPIDSKVLGLKFKVGKGAGKGVGIWSAN